MGDRNIAGVIGCLIAAAIIVREAQAQPPPGRAARDLVRRVLPGSAFRVEIIPPDQGHDVFEIESSGGELVLRGNNGVAVGSALNWYLKYYCHCHYSLKSRQMRLPNPLPLVAPKVRRVSQDRWRYLLNYCCFGYSLPWYDWADWERLIDWMALNGVNMPLAVTGEEAVWRELLRDLGLSEKQIEDFLAGPPYLPFGWMGCLDGWGGPLAADWIDRRAELQKKILARERELGMTPVLQGFTGHIPLAIRDKFPDAKLQKIRWIEWDTYFLDPLDPLFARIGKSFVEAQTKLFGSDHLYAADTFIEMTPPSSDPQFLDAMGKAISGAMVAADPQAVWVMQGWIFFNNKKFWQPPQAKAFLQSVPDERLLVLDLFCDESPVWNQTESFYGKPWIWCILQNFGNTVQLHGRLPRVNQDLFTAMNDPQRGKLSGIGMIQEGLGYNPAAFDFMTEMAWRSQPVDLGEWIAQYAHRRYGRRLPASEAAWDLLLDSAYSGASRTSSAICARPALPNGALSSEPAHIPSNALKIAQAWEQLLQSSKELGKIDSYQFDLVNVTRQVLSSLSDPLKRRMIAAFQEKDKRTFASASRDFLQLFKDMDELLASREEFLLGKWLEDAKRWGGDENEKRQYEWNARNVLTLWGGRDSSLHDYARKEWSGLIAGFYLPRWRMLIDRMDNSLKENKPFDGEAFQRDVRQWEEDWTHGNESFSSAPSGDPAALARKMYDKYFTRYSWAAVPNLTMGKPASASSVFGSYAPEKAVDGIADDLESSWQADPYPQWLQIDLEKAIPVDCLQVFPYWDGERYYRYTIDGSADGEKWSRLVDWSNNKTPAAPKGDLHIFAPVMIRYIRVNMLYDSANTGVHIVEVRAFAADAEERNSSGE